MYITIIVQQYKGDLGSDLGLSLRRILGFSFRFDSYPWNTNPFRSRAKSYGNSTMRNYGSYSIFSDFKLNFDLDDSISRFPDESQSHLEHSNAKTELFPPDGAFDDAQNIDESQFKRAVGLDDNSQSQNPSTQDIHNLDWTQTQPSDRPIKSTDSEPKEML